MVAMFIFNDLASRTSSNFVLFLINVTMPRRKQKQEPNAELDNNAQLEKRTLPWFSAKG